jgi:hypothetical protein
MENQKEPIKSPYFDEPKPDISLVGRQLAESEFTEFQKFVAEVDVLFKKYKFKSAAMFMFKEVMIDGKLMSQMHTASVSPTKINLIEILNFINQKIKEIQ